MKHSCCLQIHPEIVLKYWERCAYGVPLATETALTGDCPRASWALEDNLCHTGACEGGISVLCLSVTVIALQLGGWVKPSPPRGPGKVLKSLVWHLSSWEQDSHGCPLPAMLEKVVSVVEFVVWVKI